MYSLAKSFKKNMENFKLFLDKNEKMVFNLFKFHINYDQNDWVDIFKISLCAWSFPFPVDMKTRVMKEG